MMLDDAPITDLLFQIKEGNQEAEDRLMRLAYKVLCRMARRYLAAVPRRHHTLQPGDLVHEFVIAGRKAVVNCQNRGHFFAFAARVMRHILVDHERARMAKKRWDHLERISFEDVSLCQGQRIAGRHRAPIAGKAGKNKSKRLQGPGADRV